MAGLEIRAMETVRQMDVKPGMSVDELVRAMGGCGFGASRLADAVEIYQDMVLGDYTKFFALSGAMVPAGMRNIVAQLIRRGMIDVLVTTGANLVHDIIESISPHHLGSPEAEDADLREGGLSRIYDVYLSDEQFIQFEDLMQGIIPAHGDPVSGTAFLHQLGSRIDDENSILATAESCNVPVFCPALTDSMIGLQAWLFRQTRPLRLDLLADVKEIVDICYRAEKAGIMIVGGGVPKNFSLQSMLVTPHNFQLAVQLTTDHPEAGGLSGATLSEAISWGKLSAQARYVTVYGDATINLPLLVAAVLTRMEERISEEDRSQRCD
ncbi:MAG: putative deoxyhypusine synthase [Methanosaeta sp. PtaB.Bin039]|nr:MAG: putative deoxyhypusine synthase [Methanosaeta sp. PtaB.Bin039]OPY45212.1 MAG: putative deoxyhypusine synthase [Methanosaeta sp. PtaU1.Bin028]HQF16620.1 deoxyhypusine synthase [Methanotrichaceae archaeon]HQI91252.1 deoxyhypusine synthase [Methanotrichaceae archaeon]